MHSTPALRPVSRKFSVPRPASSEAAAESACRATVRDVTFFASRMQPPAAEDDASDLLSQLAGSVAEPTTREGGGARTVENTHQASHSMIGIVQSSKQTPPPTTHSSLGDVERRSGITFGPVPARVATAAARLTHGVTVLPLHRVAQDAEVPEVWVTAAVVVKKHEPKQGRNGRFAVLKLWDAKSVCTASSALDASLLLAGGAFDSEWAQIMQGDALLFSATRKPAAGKDGVLFTCNGLGAVVVCGRAPGIGVCGQRTRNGEPCSVLVNKKKSAACAFHIKAAAAALTIAPAKQPQRTAPGIVLTSGRLGGAVGAKTVTTAPAESLASVQRRPLHPTVVAPGQPAAGATPATASRGQRCLMSSRMVPPTQAVSQPRTAGGGVLLPERRPSATTSATRGLAQTMGLTGKAGAVAHATASANTSLALADAVARHEKKLERLARDDATFVALDAIREIEVTAFYCVPCRQWFFKRPLACASKSHQIEARKTHKRFFSCEGCGFHLAHLGDRVPFDVSCSRCSSRGRWRRATAAARPKEKKIDQNGDPVEDGDESRDTGVADGLGGELDATS